MMGERGSGISLSHRQTHNKCRPVESYAERYRNDESAHYLQKARMPFIKACLCFETSVEGRHSGIRECIICLFSQQAVV